MAVISDHYSQTEGDTFMPGTDPENYVFVGAPVWSLVAGDHVSFNNFTDEERIYHEVLEVLHSNQTQSSILIVRANPFVVPDGSEYYKISLNVNWPTRLHAMVCFEEA